MKKISFVFLVILLVIMTCACNGGQQPQEDIYSTLNRMVRDSYAVVDVQVTSTMGDTVLHSHFEVRNKTDFSTISYTCEHLATFENGQIPAERVVTSTGSAVIKDGKITSVNGEAQDLNYDLLMTAGMTFAESYFSDIETSDGHFTADVIYPNGFLGYAGKVERNMTVDVTYGDRLQGIRITYIDASGAAVTITYSFTD